MENAIEITKKNLKYPLIVLAQKLETYRVSPYN
jgi:hypothetical protein